MRTRKFWKPEHLVIMKKLYADTSTEEIAKILGRTKSSVYGQADVMGLKKSATYIVDAGRFKKGKRVSTGTEFKKGNKSWNEGTKGLTSANKASFKKGSLPKNTKHDGAISIRADRTKSGKVMKYKWIRISKANWAMLHVHVWEQANGEIPSGFIVTFKNGDTMNCELDNLQMISRLQHIEKTRQSDGYIAKTLARKTGGRGIVDNELKRELLKHPEIIEAKRQQLLLNKTIKQHGTTRKSN